MAKYILKQVDGNEDLIEQNEFYSLPTLDQFSDVAYYVDREDIRKVYKEIVGFLGEWVHAYADEEDTTEYYVDEGVYFCLEKME